MADMDAGQQQQGREDDWVRPYTCLPGVAMPCSELCRPDCWTLPQVNPAWSLTPPARDSGRDEAREAVARWLVDTIRPHHFTDDGTYDANGNLDAVIDDLLKLPELKKKKR